MDKMIEAGFKPTMFSLAKLVSNFGQNGKIDPVFRLYEVAKKHSITFDVVTFHGMIVACGKVGNLEKALEVTIFILITIVASHTVSFQTKIQGI